MSVSIPSFWVQVFCEILVNTSFVISPIISLTLGGSCKGGTMFDSGILVF